MARKFLQSRRILIRPIFALLACWIENPYLFAKPRDAGEGVRGQAPLLPFLKGPRGSEVPFLNCFYSIIATVFQPENSTEGTLCSKLTEIQLIALLPYQYKART